MKSAGIDMSPKKGNTLIHHREAEGNTLLICETIKDNTASVTASVPGNTLTYNLPQDSCQ